MEKNRRVGRLKRLVGLALGQNSNISNKRTLQTLIPLMKFILSLLGLFSLLCSPLLGADRTNVNVVWIVIEDASAHIGCYGETLIETPHIDRMAREGIRCKNAFVTSPICSSTLPLHRWPVRPSEASLPRVLQAS